MSKRLNAGYMDPDSMVEAREALHAAAATHRKRAEKYALLPGKSHAHRMIASDLERLGDQFTDILVDTQA